MGLSLGCLSLPVGNFANSSVDNNDAGFASTSYGISNMLFDFGFIFKNSHLGFSATYMAQGYSADRDVPDSKLDFAVITAGPMYSFDISDRFNADIKCHFGFIHSSYRLSGSNNNTVDGKGLGFDLRAMIRYQFSKRWFILTQCGYLYSNQKFKSLEDLQIQALNVGLGAGFKIR